MSEPNKMTGSCLCNAVKVSAASNNKEIGACHCGMCRKWGGSALLVIDCGSDISFSGTENIARYQSSEWGERGFCSKCGTHLFYHLRQNDGYYIPAGIFDSQSNFVFDHQIFIDRKPEYYSFANDTKKMTEAEVMTMFASQSEGQ